MKTGNALASSSSGSQTALAPSELGLLQRGTPQPGSMRQVAAKRGGRHVGTGSGSLVPHPEAGRTGSRVPRVLQR